jgi:hypothetical protein
MTKGDTDEACYSAPTFWRQRLSAFAKEPKRGENRRAVLKTLQSLAREERKRNP